MDKILHIIAGFLIFTVSYFLFKNIIISYMLTIIIAVGKEIYDLKTHGKPDPIDALSTVIGGFLTHLILLT